MRPDSSIRLNVSGHRCGSTGLTTSLYAYWKLEEASGNDRVDSVNGLDMAELDPVPNVAALQGNGADMSGANMNLIANYSISALDLSVGFTVAGWLLIPTSYSGTNTVLANDDNDDFDFGLYTLSLTDIRFKVFNTGYSGSSTAQYTGGITVNAWYLLAGRYNPDTKKAELSVNAGTWQYGSALADAPVNLVNLLQIGRSSGSYGKAYYDEVGWWLRYLSDAEITQLYNSGSGVTYPFS